MKAFSSVISLFLEYRFGLKDRELLCCFWSIHLSLKFRLLISTITITVLLLSQIYEAINLQRALKNNKQTGNECGSLQWHYKKATNIDFKGVPFNGDILV